LCVQLADRPATARNWLRRANLGEV
jgi:hypothetical protein